LFPRDALFYRALFLLIAIASIINKIIPRIQKTKLEDVYRSFSEVLPIKTKLGQYCGLMALPSAIAMQSSFVYDSALSFDKHRERSLLWLYLNMMSLVRFRS